MRAALLLSLLFSSAVPAQDDPGREALVAEWDVRLVARDVLQQAREIRRRERVTVLPDRLRIDDLTFGMSWIVNADSGKVFVLDPLRGRYSELTFEAVRKRQAEIADELAAAAERVPGTEDEAEIRRILEGMGRYRKPPAVELQATGKREKVLGRVCQERAAVVNGEIHLVRAWVDTGFRDGAAYFELLGKMGAFHPDVASRLKDIEGFPLRGVVRYLFFGERVAAHVEAVSVARARVEESVFCAPAGLERVPLEGFEPEPERAVPRPEDLGTRFEEDEIGEQDRGEEEKKGPEEGGKEKDQE